jgi:hypothetical protein
MVLLEYAVCKEISLKRGERRTKFIAWSELLRVQHIDLNYGSQPTLRSARYFLPINDIHGSFHWYVRGTLLKATEICGTGNYLQWAVGQSTAETLYLLTSLSSEIYRKVFTYPKSYKMLYILAPKACLSRVIDICGFYISVHRTVGRRPKGFAIY